MVSNSNRRCKVKGCKENHAYHYCKKCRERDSDHFSVRCSQKKLRNSARCKAPGCHENHKKHYCRFCKSKNSHHVARDCPKSIELYHATKIEYLEMDNGIGEIGLKPSGVNNRFGTGIYFAELKYVTDIAKNLYHEEGIVLKCRVCLGKCKDFQNSTDFNGDWKNSYESCTAIHPPWLNGITSSEFREWVIKSSQQCKIYSLTYKEKEFTMTSYQKDKEILKNLKKK